MNGKSATGLLILGMLLLGACGRLSTELPLEQAVPDSSLPAAADAQLDNALREIATLEVPEGVDNDVFAELKAELGKLLREFIASPARDASSGEELGFQSRRFFALDGFSLHIDERHEKLSWLYRLPGDYDQNGVVSAADLTPLAGSFGNSAHVDGMTGRFDPGSLDFVVDGNQDGMVSLADITPIAQNYGNAFTEFSIYATDDMTMYPWHSFGSNGETQFMQQLGTSPVATAGLSDSAVLPEGQRYFEHVLAGEPFNFYWVAISSSLQKDLHTDIALPGKLLEPRPQGYLMPYREQGTQLSYDAAENVVSFYEVYGADGNHTHVVSLSDITSVGMHLGQIVGDPFGQESSRCADYNRNGIVTANDAIMIHQLAFAEYEGYHLYYAEDAIALPAGYWGEESNDPLPDSILKDNGQFHSQITAELPFTPASGSYLYLRPYLGEELGPVSEFVEVP